MIPIQNIPCFVRVLNATPLLRLLLILSFAISAAAVEQTPAGGIVYNLRDSTSTDTISAETIMRTIEIAGQDDVLKCDSLVVKGKTNFPDTVFCELDFRNSIFINEVSTPRYLVTVFLSNVDLSCAQFLSEAGFYWAVFNSTADFTGVKFNSEAVFEGAKFYLVAKFEEAEFCSSADFREAQFFSNARFHSAQFLSVASFIFVVFNSEADFIGVKFNSNSYFPWANFLSDALFGSAEIKGTLYLRTAFFDTAASIMLDYTKYSEILIDWSQIRGKISFLDKKHNSFRKAFDHSHLQSIFQDVAHVYIPLQKNFRELGQFDDEDGCYYEMKTIERRCEKGIGKIMPTILWLTCGYGVHPEYTFYSSIVLIFFFTWLYYQHGAIEERKIETSKAVNPLCHRKVGQI